MFAYVGENDYLCMFNFNISSPMDKEQTKALQGEIRQMCKEKNAVVLAHYYTTGDIQDCADFVGDSLALARKAAETDADIIVMCGVHFMAETCKLLSPDKLVLAPDLAAGCSLADSCDADDLRQWKEEHPDYMVVQYVNTTAATKALTDVVVTSGNAKKVIDQLPKDAKILFGPDYNLGSYINSVTGREMELWNGGCHVHERFSVDAIVKLKAENPDATVMAHLECKAPVLALADVKGSTADMLKYAQNHPAQKYIVATEAGILHELQRTCPECTFIPVPPEVSENGNASDSDLAKGSCSCNECQYMKLNTLEKLRNCLRDETPQVDVPEDIAREAVKPIERMLQMS